MVNDALGRPGRTLVLGGSSDIAHAIVRRITAGRPGEVVLAGRPSSRCAAVADQVRADGSQAVEVDLDVLDTAGHAGAIAEIVAGGDLDLVIVAFGALGEQEHLLADPQAAAELARTNYVGAVSLGVALAGHLRAQGHGTIVALSSVAAERPRRSNFVYGSTKAGFDAFFSGLGDELRDDGVDVLVVRPGFVRTRLTEHLSAAPLATTPDVVAARTVDALRRRRHTTWAPRPMRVVAAVLRLLPRAVIRRLRF